MGKPTVREACRRRMPLDGTDAQALEGVLQQVERELIAAKEENERLREFAKGIAERVLNANSIICGGCGGQMVGQEIWKISFKITGNELGIIQTGYYELIVSSPVAEGRSKILKSCSNCSYKYSSNNKEWCRVWLKGPSGELFCDNWEEKNGFISLALTEKPKADKEGE